MRKLGRLNNVFKNGLLIVESSVKNPEKIMRAIVYDEDMRRIGIVVDVFGNIDHPYIVVKPDSRELAETFSPGTIFYYYLPRKRVEEKRRRKSKGGGRRRKKK